MSVHSHRFALYTRFIKLKLSLVFVTSLLFLSVSLPSLSAENGLKPGDIMPAIVIKNVRNYRSSSIAFASLKGKLVILDFWATWCSPCVKKMPDMDALQKKYGDKLQIVLVTAEKEDKFRAFINKGGYPNSLPFVIGDTVLSSLFPHKFIPHYGWIGADGKVLALTGPDDVNAANVEAAIAGTAVSGITKIDIDRSKPLFSSVNLPDSWIRNFSLLVKGYYPGLPSGTVYRKTNEIVTGVALSNFSMKSLYLMAARNINRKFLKQQLLAELPAGDPWYTTTSPGHADSVNSYSFELRVPPEKAKELYLIMFENLNQYSGYHAQFETRHTSCLVLLTTGSKPIDPGIEVKAGIQIKGDRTLFRNVPLSGLINRLNDQDHFERLVVDETGFTGTTDLELRLTPDIDQLNSQLKPYGLQIKEASREIVRLVITKG